MSSLIMGLEGGKNSKISSNIAPKRPEGKTNTFVYQG